MQGIDTSVLIRYLINDDEKQFLKASQFIEECCENGIPIFINSIVLCELFWVLDSCYHYKKDIITAVFEKLLQVKHFKIEHPIALYKALNAYQKDNGDFVDHFIGAINQYHNCLTTVSFDKKSSKTKAFALL